MASGLQQENHSGFGKRRLGGGGHGSPDSESPQLPGKRLAHAQRGVGDPSDHSFRRQSFLVGEAVVVKNLVSKRKTAPVLVVDDDDGITQFVKWVLKDEGYEVATAANGVSALDRARVHPPAVILLDMRMPVMDGWEFAREYRRVNGGASAPIVVMTAAGDAEARAAQIGADAVLAKPFDVDELLRVVASLTTPRGGTLA